jgi:hypothetical protein
VKREEALQRENIEKGANRQSLPKAELKQQIRRKRLLRKCDSGPSGSYGMESKLPEDILLIKLLIISKIKERNRISMIYEASFCCVESLSWPYQESTLTPAFAMHVLPQII